MEKITTTKVVLNKQDISFAIKEYVNQQLSTDVFTMEDVHYEYAENAGGLILSTHLSALTNYEI